MHRFGSQFHGLLMTMALVMVAACSDDTPVNDEQYFDSDGVRIHYNVYGDGPDGRLTSAIWTP
jgi:hypothetical protein